MARPRTISASYKLASQNIVVKIVEPGDGDSADDRQAPWEGCKYSGVGRAYGRYGIEAFLETQAVFES